MTHKRIEIGKIDRDRYNPPDGVDISWHDDDSCTIHYDTPSQLATIKNDLKSKRELPDHSRNPKRTTPE